MTLSTARVHLANYYNRVHRKIYSAIDAASQFIFAGTSTYILPGTPNDCNDGQGRVSYVVPYRGTDLKATWGTGMFATSGSTVLAVEQNTTQTFLRIPASDSAFGQYTSFGAGFANLFANSENEGYNYIQEMVWGTSGFNHTVWTGTTVSSGESAYGMRGYINA
jgi:hypothetical protein